tara:strand:- start:2147 stop:2347 length:201 start_codon:yes stop_codon:yes gene_type:complete
MKDKKININMEGGDQSPTNKSVLKDTNVHPLISDVFNNIFNMTQRNKEWEEIKKSLNLTEDEKRNI